MGRGAWTSWTGSTIYEFRVDGRLPENCREVFFGMLVEEIPPGLVLRGAVIDEPHLLGIIDQLRILGLGFVSARPAKRSAHVGVRSPTVSTPSSGARGAARRLKRRSARRDDRD